MKRYGLIGKTLQHSFSKQYFESLFDQLQLPDYRYDLFEMQDIGELPSFIAQHPDLGGFNVTIPYKQAIMPYLDEIDPVAQSVGAVNCVRIDKIHGISHLHGFNTDIVGFRNSLSRKTVPAPALILGTGGAAAAVAYALSQSNVEYQYVSRTAKRQCLLYQDITPDILRAHPLIINCTPVGMYPHSHEAPALPYSALTSNHFLYDLIYNPPLSLFLAEGKKHHAQIQNGLEMLHLQADASWQIFCRKNLI